MVKNPPTDAEDVNSIPGYQEDPLQEKMPAHSSIFGWESLWMEEPDGLQTLDSQRVRLLHGIFPTEGSNPGLLYCR